jgi:hypothetical protein
MTEKTDDLDQHRGMAAQKATNLRRLLADVAANEQALRAKQDELDSQMIAGPASNWHEAAEIAICWRSSPLVRLGRIPAGES